jgi:predicted membrane channel-forming protein YqfA (hemolysin III family)
MEEQNFKNHRKINPIWHFIVYASIVVLIAGSLINLYKAYENKSGRLDAGLVTLAGIILLLIAWYTRSFALRAQDRAIRAEENLRYFAIQGTSWIVN